MLVDLLFLDYPDNTYLSTGIPGRPLPTRPLSVQPKGDYSIVELAEHVSVDNPFTRLLTARHLVSCWSARQLVEPAETFVPSFAPEHAQGYNVGDILST